MAEYRPYRVMDGRAQTQLLQMKVVGVTGVRWASADPELDGDPAGGGASLVTRGRWARR